MFHHKELASVEPAKKKEPFPVEEWERVQSVMTDNSEKSRAIYALIDFIRCTGCRPGEAIRILEAHGEQLCLREVTAADLKGAKYAEGACYIAHLHPDQTKTRLQYRWWLRGEDARLYGRLVEAREYHAAGRADVSGGRLSYRQVQYKWDSMMRQLKIQTRDGRPHTLYSLRRAIAQEAYDERLEEEYHFATDESDEEEGDGKKVGGPTRSKAIQKRRRTSEKARQKARRAAANKLQHNKAENSTRKYVREPQKDH